MILLFPGVTPQIHFPVEFSNSTRSWRGHHGNWWSPWRLYWWNDITRVLKIYWNTCTYESSHRSVTPATDRQRNWHHSFFITLLRYHVFQKSFSAVSYFFYFKIFENQEIFQPVKNPGNCCMLPYFTRILKWCIKNVSNLIIFAEYLGRPFFL